MRAPVQTPFVQEIDFRDPQAAFAPLAREPFALFFDSATTHTHVGRWSFICARPRRTLIAHGRRLSIDGVLQEGNPFDALEALLRGGASHPAPGGPPFQGGAAGLFGYDLLHHLERVQDSPEDDMGFPDMAIGFYDAVAAFDVVEKRAFVTGREDDAADALVKALGDRPGPSCGHETAGIGRTEWRSNFTRGGYEAAVARVIELIRAGDIYQANLSQRFHAVLPEGFDPYAHYRRLRQLNAAPFAAFLNLGDTVIASSSPERFLEVRDRAVETRPIKGTRPRGTTPDEDAALAYALRESAKDIAENTMIADLLRNDLARVCEDFSVKVHSLCALESYARVHHLVSTVTGRLRDGCGPVDLLRAAFPGGSITGVPKVRAMEVISTLEPTRRGPYCGSLGWIGYNGAMDTNIAIRTVAYRNGRAAFQAGGGIVLDSDPAAEYDETLAKADAIFESFAPKDENSGTGGPPVAAGTGRA